MRQEKYTYKEIKTPSTAIYKEKESKFIAYSYVVYSKNEIKDKIDNLKKKEKRARHFCYAYILNEDKSIQMVNDDGEPSSTAGKPILGQILSKDLTNILIVVVRYFGGVKLGVSGLIRAYKLAAREVINQSEIITKSIQEYYQINFKYVEINNVMQIVKKYDLEIIKSRFKKECRIIFAVSKEHNKRVSDIFKKYHILTINKLENGTIKKTM